MRRLGPAAPQTPGKRFFFLRFAVARLPVPAVNISFVAFVSAALVWRFASAVIRARAALTTEFAPPNHMLMNGFFFNQGLDMCDYAAYFVEGTTAARSDNRTSRQPVAVQYRARVRCLP